MRTSLKIVAGAMLVVLLSLVILYAALRSPLALQRFWRPVIYRQSGFSVEAKQFDIDLFSGVTLTKLHMRRNGDAPIDATLEHLRLRYSFLRLLRGKIDITALDINGLKLKGNVRLAPPSAEPRQHDDASAPFAFAPLLAQLNEAEPEVSIRHLAITPIQLDLELDNGTQQIDVKGKFALHGTLQKETDTLNNRLDLNVSDITAHLLRPEANKRLDTEIAHGHLLLNLTMKHAQNASFAPAKPPIVLHADFHQQLVLRSFAYHDANASIAIEHPLFEQLQASAKSRIDPDHIQNGSLQWQADTTVRHSDFQFIQKRQTLHFAPEKFHLFVEGKTVGTPHKALLPDIENHIAIAMKPSAFSFEDENRSMKMHAEYALTLDTLAHPRSEQHATQWQPVQATLHQQLRLTQSSLKIPSNTFSFDSALWRLDGTYAPSRLELQSDIDAKAFSAPALSAPISPTIHLTLSADPKEKTVLLHGTVMPKTSMPTLTFDLTAADRPNTLSFTTALKLRLDPALRQWFPQADSLQQFGPVKLALQNDTRLRHGAKSLHDANRSKLPQWDMHSESNATLSQLQPPTQDKRYLSEPLQMRLTLKHDMPQRYRADLSLQSEGILAPPLRTALPVSLALKTDLDTQLTTVTLDTNATLAHLPLLNAATTFENRPGNFAVQSRFVLNAYPAWQTYLPQLKPLEQLASLQLSTILAFNAMHPYYSLTDIPSANALQHVNISGDLNGTLTQSDTAVQTRVLLPKPLRFNHRFRYNAARASLKANYDIQELLLPKKLHLRNDTLHLFAKVEKSVAPKKIALRLHAEGEQITLQPDKNGTFDATNLLLPLRLELDAHRTSTRAVCDRFESSFGDGWLRQRLYAEATLDAKTAAAKGTLWLTPRPLPPYLISGTGNMTLPWSADMLQTRQFSLRGKAIFNHMTLRSSNFEAVGLHGHVPFSEALQRHKDGTFGFSYLLMPEPFQRVDFERIEPYLHIQARLGAASLAFGAIHAAPLAAAIEIDQNLLQLQQFTVGILGGYFTGRLYVNAAPSHYTVGLLGRLSRVDLRGLLPNAETFDAAPLNARTALRFDLNRRLLEGRIDITDIDRPQLLQLLELIDSDHTDSQLEQVRSALRLGYPQYVAVSMHQGLLDLDVGISLLAEPIRVRGIPLSPLLQHYAAPYLERLNHLPLE